MLNKAFFNVFVIKNLSFNMLAKLQQYLGKYIKIICLYMGHANINYIHLQKDYCVGLAYPPLTRFVFRRVHSKDHHKNGTNCLPTWHAIY